MIPPVSASRASAASAIHILGMSCALLLLSGCSHVYQVKVDAIRTPEVAPRRSYHLVAADTARAEADPLRREACTLVGRALEAQGLFAASRPEWADMIIELDWGIGQRRLISAPDASARDAGAHSVYRPDRDGDSVEGGTGSQVPPAAFTRVVARWEKSLSLVARENLSSGGAVRAGAELWRVDVTVQDSSDSLEALMPVLAAGLVDSIDRTTQPQTYKRITPGAVLALTTPRHE